MSTRLPPVVFAYHTGGHDLDRHYLSHDDRVLLGRAMDLLCGMGGRRGQARGFSSEVVSAAGDAWRALHLLMRATEPGYGCCSGVTERMW